MSAVEEVSRFTPMAGENRLELLLFQLDGEQIFGINVFKIREILRCPPLRHIPYSNRHVRGVMQARGQTLPVIDLAQVLAQPAGLELPESTVIVTEYCGLVLGYLVRKVVRIANLRWEDVKPPPALLGDDHYMTAVTNLGGAQVQIIDIEKVLAEIVGVSSDTTEIQLAPASASDLPRHVFIAEDSTVARKQITRVMEQIGVTFEVAENGRLALEKLREYAAAGPINTQFGMLIADIEMPEMDGYTLTKTLKADPALKDLYVCLHTSLSGSFNHTMAATVGADRLMPKFDANELAQAVIAVLT
jgi:two-component system, chemotaxis family, chemotaxis protein CheV